MMVKGLSFSICQYFTNKVNKVLYTGEIKDTITIFRIESLIRYFTNNVKELYIESLMTIFRIDCNFSTSHGENHHHHMFLSPLARSLNKFFRSFDGTNKHEEIDLIKLSQTQSILPARAMINDRSCGIKATVA